MGVAHRLLLYKTVCSKRVLDLSREFSERMVAQEDRVRLGITIEICSLRKFVQQMGTMMVPN
jgi:hypothetical protein